jgi:DnaJ-class molecular chaperone
VRNRRNYYRILHVQPDAPAEIIDVSYHTLMHRLRMHPSLGGATWNAAVVEEAYTTLKNPELRMAYDRRLRREAIAAAQAETGALAAPRDGARIPVCPFCDTRHALDAVMGGALCDVCGSPLRPAERYKRSAAAIRALERVVRRMAVTISLPCAPDTGISGTTEDISITGMQFTTTIQLLVDEILRVECTFCAAVGIVRHVRATRAREPRWRVGIEFLTLRIKETKGGIVSVRA